MKIKYITAFWQSLALMHAGLDKETADYVYQRDMELSQPIENGNAKHYEPVYIPRPREEGDAFTTDLVPAWSLGRLWDFYLEKGWVFEFGTNFSAEEVIQALADGIIKNSKK